MFQRTSGKSHSPGTCHCIGHQLRTADVCCFTYVNADVPADQYANAYIHAERTNADIHTDRADAYPDTGARKHGDFLFAYTPYWERSPRS